MIPIQCPRCGKGGSVPLDRLNAKLYCKGCQSSFHVDNSGRTVLGNSGESKAHARPQKAKKYYDGPDITLSGLIGDIPRPVMVGVPAVLVLAMGWMLNPFASNSVAYEQRAEAVARAVLDNQRDQVVAAALPNTGEQAGQWFDMVRQPITTKGVGNPTGVPVSASLFAGNAEKDASLMMSCTITTDTLAESFNLPLARDGNTWKVDGARALEEARNQAATRAPVKVASQKR